MLPVPYAARIAALEAICQVISYSIADGSDHSCFRVGREVVGFALLRDLDPVSSTRSRCSIWRSRSGTSNAKGYCVCSIQVARSANPTMYSTPQIENKHGLQDATTARTDLLLFRQKP